MTTDEPQTTHGNQVSCDDVGAHKRSLHREAKQDVVVRFVGSDPSRVMTISAAAILAYPDTKLGAMLQHHLDGTMKAGLHDPSVPSDVIVLDEDPDILAAVLNFYRYGKLACPSCVPTTVFDAAVEHLLLSDYALRERKKLKLRINIAWHHGGTLRLNFRPDVFANDSRLPANATDQLYAALQLLGLYEYDPDCMEDDREDDVWHGFLPMPYWVYLRDDLTKDQVMQMLPFLSNHLSAFKMHSIVMSPIVSDNSVSAMLEVDYIFPHTM